MRIFFSLAPHFMATGDYETRVRGLARNFDLKPVFAHEAPPQLDPGEWIADALGECQFAFFDLTGFDPDVLFAYGVASQNDDVDNVAMLDIDEHIKLLGPRHQSKFFTGTRLKTVKTFDGAANFSHKAHVYLEGALGAAALRDQLLIGRIKDAIRRSGRALPMREIATTVGRQIWEIQHVVYGLVRNGDFRKIGDTRWTRYELS